MGIICTSQWSDRNYLPQKISPFWSFLECACFQRHCGKYCIFWPPQVWVCIRLMPRNQLTDKAWWFACILTFHSLCGLPVAHHITKSFCLVVKYLPMCHTVVVGRIIMELNIIRIPIEDIRLVSTGEILPRIHTWFLIVTNTCNTNASTKFNVFVGIKVNMCFPPCKSISYIMEK